jgi:hypothetical protein
MSVSATGRRQAPNVSDLVEFVFGITAAEARFDLSIPVLVEERTSLKREMKYILRLSSNASGDGFWHGAFFLPCYLALDPISDARRALSNSVWDEALLAVF